MAGFLPSVLLGWLLGLLLGLLLGVLMLGGRVVFLLVDLLGRVGEKKKWVVRGLKHSLHLWPRPV
ncbi:hypothetical protein GQ53DRAFT_755462 [Thozetella sp. PMI_491]|nr:hypothetical protein GQ53DRAFT_755462 [Thozetella sp. PMI_491]